MDIGRRYSKCQKNKPKAYLSSPGGLVVCWAHEPAARPSFLAILDLLDELASAGLVEQDTAVATSSAKACCVVS